MNETSVAVALFLSAVVLAIGWAMRHSDHRLLRDDLPHPGVQNGEGDETWTTGGAIVPRDLLDEMAMQWTQPLPFALLPSSPPEALALPPRRPLMRLLTTFRMRRTALAGWLHDRLFGEAYCKHDGCDW